MRAGAIFRRVVDHALDSASSRMRSVAYQPNAAAPTPAEFVPSSAPARDALTGTATVAETAAAKLPLEQRILDVDWAGRPSGDAVAALQELTTRRVLAEVTTPELALERFRAIADKGVDHLQPDELRTLHALMAELPEGLRVPRPDSSDLRLAGDAGEMQRFPAGRAWFLGEGPSQIVTARAFDALPDPAAARARLRDLLQLRTHSRDSILEIRAILDGLPPERIPPEVAAWPERAQAVRQLGWVTKTHDGVQHGFATHQEAGGLLFRLRNHVSGSDESELLAQLDALLDKPLASWEAGDLREFNQLIRHPHMPKPEVRLGWDLEESLRQILRGSGSSYGPFSAADNSMLALIYTDLRVARNDRLGMMGDRTHELAGRIVEGTATPAELQELRIIGERQPAVGSMLPAWVRSPDRRYSSLDQQLRDPVLLKELRLALESSVDVTGPSNELRELAGRTLLEDDEAIRLVRVAGRLDAFGVQLPGELVPRVRSAAEQALLVSGTDPAVAAITQRLAKKFDWTLDDGLLAISQGRRIAALLSRPQSVTPIRANASETVRDALAVVDDMLAPASGIDARLRPTLERSRDVLRQHQARLAPGAAKVANQSGIIGYGAHADYREIGAAASNVELGTELLIAARRTADEAATKAAQRGTAAESLAW